MALLCDTFDLDIDDLAQVRESALETIAYLNNVVSAINNRVLAGEKVEGLKVVDGKKTRTITDKGYEYLEKTLGRENVYKTVEKPIGIGELEKMLETPEFAALYEKGVVVYKVGAKKVVPTNLE